MKMLRGTRAAIGRKGFDADLKALASSTYEDFLDAMQIANPNESIVSAANRKDMPAKIRTALQGSALQGLAVSGKKHDHRFLTVTGYGHDFLTAEPQAMPMNMCA